MCADEYLLDNRARDAGRRFEALSAVFDPVTFRHVDALGIAEGWRCWEIGAGGPSVPAGLAERVGPTGHVLATDIDVRWLEREAGAPFEVRRHDIGDEEPPGGGFDLIHARLVLVHVPERDAALARIARALRPGGRLLLEDFDPELQPRACLQERDADERLANRIRAGFLALLAQRGVDNAYGRKLAPALRGVGLVDVGADAYFPVARPAAAALESANVRQVREGLAAQGHATEEEIERHLAGVEGGKLDIALPPLVSAWGRRP